MNKTPPIYVYRLQNSKGNGVYRPEETSKRKKIYSPYSEKVVLNLVDKLVREPALAMRFPPHLSALMTKADLKAFYKQEYLSGFISLPQLFAWFPFAEELKVLNDLGYDIYRVQASKIISIPNQVIFKPLCSLGKCSEILSPEMISEDDVEMIFQVIKEQQKNVINFINKAKKNSYVYNKYVRNEDFKKDLIKFILMK